MRPPRVAIIAPRARPRNPAAAGVQGPETAPPSQQGRRVATAIRLLLTSREEGVILVSPKLSARSILWDDYAR